MNDPSKALTKLLDKFLAIGIPSSSRTFGCLDGWILDSWSPGRLDVGSSGCVNSACLALWVSVSRYLFFDLSLYLCVFSFLDCADSLFWDFIFFVLIAVWHFMTSRGLQL